MSVDRDGLETQRNGKDSGVDFFAELAGRSQLGAKQGLYEPRPPELPDIELPLQLEEATAGFAPMEKLKSSQQLEAELDEMRRRYEPFMANLAPRLQSHRKKMKFTSFDWRVETPQDGRNFSLALAGEGEWEKVQIPHYGPPLGEATTLYRKKFEVSEEQLASGAAFMCFRGVDYKAYAFVNSYCVGFHEGFFAPFEFEVSQHLHVGENYLVVRVENSAVFNGNDTWGQAEAGEKIYAATGPGYDEPELGWHHCPPGMGIYQEAYLEFRPNLFVSDVFVRPLPEESEIEVWIEVGNASQRSRNIEISASIYGRNFEAVVVEEYRYSPELIPTFGLGDAFQIAKAKAEGRFEKSVPLSMRKGSNFLKFTVPMEGFRWWSLSEPWLYLCQITLSDGEGNVLDTAEQHFGMRSFSMDEESMPKGRFEFNGEPIRLRGANTMGHEQQCVMSGDFDQLRDDLLLAKIGNMNFLRLTQRPVQQEVYDYCDMLGLMTQTDFPLFGVIRSTKYGEVLRQIEEMELHVRSHPCNVLVTYINEPCPQSDNQPHRHLSRDEMEGLFAAASARIKQLNPERVIKPCDGDYDPPAPGLQDRHCYPYWYNGHGIDVGKLHRGFWQLTKEDWSYGCGEFGAEGLDSADLMRRRYPGGWLACDEPGSWSPSQISWAQTGNFHRFFYDTQSDLENWVEKSQGHQAWATKMMVEAFRRDNRMTSFAIHLFIDAFPGGWMKAIMDCERNPKPAYFAYRDALAPLLPSLRTDRRFYYSGETISIEAWLCNDFPTIDESWELRYHVMMDGECLASGNASALTEANGSRFQGYLSLPAPDVDARTTLSCHLGLVDAGGAVLNSQEHEVDVFPTLTSGGEAAVVIGEADGSAALLAEELGLRFLVGASHVEKAERILVDDYAAYDRHRDEVDRMVALGARIVFLNFEEGNYTLLGSSVTFKESEYNPLFFVSRDTCSELIQGFSEQDFMHWYDPKLDRISHLLTTTFQGEDFDPVLLSCNTVKGKWEPAMAAGEKAFGLGACLVSQIELAGRTGTNPPAKLYARRLLGIDRVEGNINRHRLMEHSPH